MGKIEDTLTKCVWLIQTIKRLQPISGKELQELWKSSPLSEGRSWTGKFSDYINKIESELGIKIKSNGGKASVYSIENENIEDCFMESEFPKWFYDTTSTKNMVIECKAIRDRLLLERVADDSGLLRLFLDSIKNRKRIRIIYKKYGEEKCSQRIIDPYCVKLNKRRWYVLGRNNGNGKIIESYNQNSTGDDTKRKASRRIKREYRIYAFDRIIEATVLDKKFKVDRNFDAESFFNEYYGVYTDGKAEKVVLHVYGKYQDYIENLKIHSSQRPVKLKDDQNEYTIYKLNLSLTPDFVSYLVSCGEFIKVIEPPELVDKVRNTLLAITKRYQSTEKSAD